MGALTGLIEHMDWMSMLLFLMSGAACLICLTVHELAHGLAAYRLGGSDGQDQWAADSEPPVPHRLDRTVPADGGGGGLG